MIPFVIKPASKIKGRFLIPFDKSITHRAIILSAISQGVTEIKNFSLSLDCLYTLKIFKQLGVKIKVNKNNILIYGNGLDGLVAPKKALYAGESGTTIRMLVGLLSGQNFKSNLHAASSLNRRPMARVIKPLVLMGAIIKSKIKISLPAGRQEKSKIEHYPPLIIQPARLHGIKYKLEVPSAQVKSAILLAGLYAEGKTQIIEPEVCRDHTERMLKLFGVDIKVKQSGVGCLISLNPTKHLVSPKEIIVPGDFSSAIFFIVAALIVPGSKLTLKGVGLNPTRTGALKVLKRMKADIKIKNYRVESGEPVGDIEVQNVTRNRHACFLRATRIKHQELPLLIDELPILMVVASKACGTTIIEKAKELRVKETDRINSLVGNLRSMGADINVKNDDTIIIRGPARLCGANLKSFGDHRTAMSLTVAALTARGSSRLDDISCTRKSFPEFKKIFKNIIIY